MIKNNKKTYSKPEVTVHVIDNEISLVMMSYIDPNDPPPPPASAQSDQTSPTEKSNFTTNPFE